MQTNIREGTYAKLSEYYGKSEEDVMAWCEKVERVAAANNWRDGQIHMIIAAYLKGATTDYYEEDGKKSIYAIPRKGTLNSGE